VSACLAHREWIEAQLALGRNAVSIHQDLTGSHGVHHCYNSVERFVLWIKARDPERFEAVEFLPEFSQGSSPLTSPVSDLCARAIGPS
jgi:hypothetical protein